MATRTFGGHTVSELKEFRQNAADGAKFYMALREAAYDFFNLAGEAEELEAVIEKLVSALEKAAGDVSAQGGNDDAVQLLRNALSDPQVKKAIGS
ncbi:MAG: hypothetical protein CMM60_12630 [Rhodospirillaceae bacterium]|jgi:hypothetical protein|nr:hypothetical protein [Rhodospirillaceae bacterium]|tara:strand:- start:1480 stop:1764 length:285 start_codon:yes stop_codon:yes gene_type:complete